MGSFNFSSTRSASFSSTRSANFSSTRSTNFAATDSSSQIASTYPSTFIDSQIAYGYLIYFNGVKLVIIVGKIFIANTNRLASFVIDT
jgi:hypothetical protein